MLFLLNYILSLILSVHYTCSEMRTLERNDNKTSIATPCRIFYPLSLTCIHDTPCSASPILQISHPIKNFSHFQVVRI